MRIKRRTNLLWGLVLLALTLVAVLRALQIVPASTFDLVLRAWPALLLLLGLSLVLRSRVTFGSGVALLVSVVITAGIAYAGFTTRATQQRDDYQEPVVQDIGDNVTLLRLQINTLATDVELLRRLGEDRTISGEFVGSAESQLEVTYTESDIAADLTVDELQANAFPMLDNVGRGTLRLELPANVPLDINLRGLNGDVTLNTSGLLLERLNLDVVQGDALVTLPVYAPQFSDPDTMLGTLAVATGDMTVFVDTEVAGHFQLVRDPGTPPIYDASSYNLLANPDALEARDFDTSDIVVRYQLVVPRGTIQLREPPT